MRVKLWGVRGSLPSPLTPDLLRLQLEETLTGFEQQRRSNASLTAIDYLNSLPPHLAGGYGGNTSCGEVTQDKTRLLIDAGSGLRAFSDGLLKSEPEVNEFHLYFTHFHWDHLIGLPFFTPLYMPGRVVHFYAVHDDLEENLRHLFRKPNFPVPYETIEKQIRVHKLKPREAVKIGGISLTPYQLDHPDPCWGARIEAGGKALTWSVDTECTRSTREELGLDIGLYQNSELMVFDGQYTFDEAIEKANWGHSSGPIGIDLALREGIKQVVFVHHDPSATDLNISMAEEQTSRYFEEIVRARKKAGAPLSDLRWHFGREGETFDL